MTDVSALPNVTHNGRSAAFSAGVSLPAGTGPFPAVVTGNAPGAMRISSRAAGNRAEWRDWQTPVLGSTPSLPTGATITNA